MNLKTTNNGDFNLLFGDDTKYMWITSTFKLLPDTINNLILLHTCF